MRFIENKPMKEKKEEVTTKSGKKRKHKKNKGNKIMPITGEVLKNIPLLKGFETNPFTPDSSADRMTSACTPHSKKERDGNIIIRDEGEELPLPKISVFHTFVIE